MTRHHTKEYHPERAQALKKLIQHAYAIGKVSAKDRKVLIVSSWAQFKVWSVLCFPHPETVLVNTDLLLQREGENTREGIRNLHTYVIGIEEHDPQVRAQIQERMQGIEYTDLVNNTIVNPTLAEDGTTKVSVAADSQV